MDLGWTILIRGVLLPIVMMIGLLSAVPIWIWMERRVSAKIQQRVGPNRVGPQGLLQPIADAIKLVFKEDITPTNVDKLIYLMAPIVTMIPAVMAFAVVPFGHDLSIRQKLFWGPVVATIPAQVSDINIGVLYILALSSIAVYGVVLAGWSSNSKWSLLGGVRSAAQMVSYELGLGLSILAVVIGSSAFAAGGEGGSALSLRTAVESQRGLAIFGWNAWWQIPAFVIFCICALAETNRAPFDLPEAEQELTGGFHTEYSAFRFAMFFMGEYVHMTTLSAVGVSLFLGGWLSPFAGIPVISAISVEHVPVLGALAPIMWFALKIVLCITAFIWARFTLPRLRWDQLMKLGWMVLLPGALAWLVVVAVVQSIGLQLAGGGLVPQLSAVDIYRLLMLLAYVAAAVVVMIRKPSRRTATA